MGNRQFYDQMLADVCYHQQEQVTDEIDVTNMQEYMKVGITWLLSITRDNEWTNLLLLSLLSLVQGWMNLPPTWEGGKTTGENWR